MDPILSIAVLSVVIGAVIAFVFFRSYLLKQRSEVQTIAKPDLHSDSKKHSKPPQHVSRKSHSKSHARASDKVPPPLSYFRSSVDWRMKLERDPKHVLKFHFLTNLSKPLDFCFV